MTLRFAADRILVQCPSWVGDAVMATPALRCLRRNYPRAHITWLMRSYVQPVLANAPWCDAMVTYDPHKPREDAGGLLRTVLALRRERFDLAVLLTHSFRSALLVRLAGVRRRVGISCGDQSFLLTDVIAWPRAAGRRLPIAKVDLYAHVLRYLGCQGWEEQRQELFFSPAQDETVCQLLAARGVRAGQPLFCLVPGAAYGESKHWYTDRFQQVGDNLAQQYGAALAIIVSPGEKKLAEQIAAGMRVTPLVFADGEMDLGCLKPLVARASLMVTTDTGPRHYAVAFGVPVVVLMGPTDPRLTASNYERTVILRHQVPCGPCQRRRCRYAGKVGYDRRCMDLITVDEVMTAAEFLLHRWPPHPFLAPGEHLP